MRTKWIRAACIFVTFCFPAGLMMAQGRDYVDPDGSFALRGPEGWKSAREPIPGAGWVTTFSQGDAHMAIAVLGSEQLLDASMLDAAGGALLSAAIQQIQLTGEVYSQSIQRISTPIGGVSSVALRCDLEFSSQEAGGTRQKGYMLALLGRRVAVLASVSAPLTDTTGYRSADFAMNTLAVESRVPGGGTVSAGTSPPVAEPGANAADLARLAAEFKGDFHRKSWGEVLVPGTPPLTYGSVAAFAELVGECFDIQLTEAEFDATRQRMIEYYTKQNAEGKTILAQGWGQLLQEIRGAQGPARLSAVEEIRTVMADRFRTGAKAGIGWAVIMEDAIAKRSQSVARVSTDKPEFAKDKRFDNDFSEADLEASLEMLYFMWVAAGRNAAVSPETVVQVKMSLVQGYASFSPDLQYVLANAQQIYAGLRNQWQKANPVQRLQMAQVFGQQLDALGFTVPQPRRTGGSSSGGAWSDWEGKSHAAFAGEMVVGLAGSSYKSAW